MGRYRRVEVMIWNDERFRLLSDDAKLTFLFILTHPAMTSTGLMRHTIAGLAEELQWERQRFSVAVKSIPKSMLQIDSQSSCFLLPNFLKHNPPSNPKMIQGWSVAIDGIPECALRQKAARLMLDALKDNPKWSDYLKGLDWFVRISKREDQEEEDDDEGKPKEDTGSPSAQEVVDAWNAMAAKTNGIVSEARMTAERRKHLTTRRKDKWWVEHWKQALDKIPSCPALLGGMESGWVCTLTWFLKHPDSATKIMEGTYSHGKRKTGNQAKVRDNELDTEDSLF